MVRWYVGLAVGSWVSVSAMYLCTYYMAAYLNVGKLSTRCAAAVNVLKQLLQLRNILDILAIMRST